MKKYYYIIISVIVLSLFATVYIYLKSDYNEKLLTLQDFYWRGYVRDGLFVFYFHKGEFPVKVIYTDRDYYEESNYYDSLFQNNIVETIHLEGEEVLAYYPIYNRNNGKRESFVLLSAGIDGKMNNNITDTLYMDSWWTQLKIYNFQEIMANTFFKQAYNRIFIMTTHRFVHIGYDFDKNVSSTIESMRPKFSIFDYLWGKKDYVVMYGFDEYLEPGMSDFDFEKILKDRNLLNTVPIDGWTLEQWKAL